MLNLTSQVIALTAKLCSAEQKLQAVDYLWPETLVLHPDVPKIIRYPTFENTCAIDPSCEDCSPLSEIQIFCRGCERESAVNIPDEDSILIYGAAQPSTTHIDLELVAIWPDGSESSVQSMKVDFVDPLCDKFHFTSLENPLLRADARSNTVISKPIGPFQNSADSCGGRVFTVIGRCLSLKDQDESNVIISLDASDNGECKAPGLYQGSLIISFDRFQNRKSIIDFNYALDCNPGFELVGSDASDQDYILGGPNLSINIGTWRPKSECGSTVY